MLLWYFNWTLVPILKLLIHKLETELPSQTWEKPTNLQEDYHAKHYFFLSKWRLTTRLKVKLKKKKLIFMYKNFSSNLLCIDWLEYLNCGTGRLIHFWKIHCSTEKKIDWVNWQINSRLICQRSWENVQRQKQFLN